MFLFHPYFQFRMGSVADEGFLVGSLGDIGCGRSAPGHTPEGQHLTRRDDYAREILGGWISELSENYITGNVKRGYVFYDHRGEVEHQLHILRIPHYLMWWTKLDTW